MIDPVPLAAPDSAWYFDAVAAARATPWLNEPAMLLTRYGLVAFGIAVAVVLVRARSASDQRVADIVWVPLAAAVAGALGWLIKLMVGEPRPCLALPPGATLWACDASGSFPSNHAAITAAAAVSMLGVNRSWGWVAVGFALLMAGSRVYIGAHYPHDVLAGLVLGGLVAAAGPLVRRPLVAVVHRVRGSAQIAAHMGEER